jgi:Na+-driven multidrug efflux pump
MSIYFAAAPAIMLYNFGSNVLQVSGDSQRPLYYMMISGSLNVVLNFVLCIIMEEKVAAVAIATAASQILGAFLVLRRISVIEGDCKLRIRGSRFNWRSFKLLMVNGLPIGFSSALYSLANLQIQTALNSFGAEAIAGNSATINVEGIMNSIAVAPWSSAIGVFVGQNVGAGNKKRVKQSIIVGLSVSIGLALFFGAIVILFSAPLLSLFVGGGEAVRYGQIRMLYIILPYAIAALNGMLANSIQAFGYSIFSTVNSILSVFVFRMFWMNFIYPLCPTFHVLMQCFLVSWTLTALVNLIFFFYIYYGKFKADKLKKMG